MPVYHLLGAFGEPQVSDVDAFLMTYGHNPAPSDVASFLKMYSGSMRYQAAQDLVAKGVPQSTVQHALAFLETGSKLRLAWPKIAGVLVTASAAASGYHGYRRNKSLGWAALWFLAGLVLPIFTPVIALAQGFGKPKKES